MHELSLARAIVVEVSNAAADRGIDRVARIDLRVGVLCGVVSDALTFAFGLAAVDTVAENAVLDIVRTEVTLWCDRCCLAVRPAERLVFVCPTCQSSCAKVLSGRDFEISGFVGEDSRDGVLA
ncbi:MAG: hydrogenase maturation nickel metallochaperone HypA/HybF [Ferrimicrobium sp.]